MASSAFPEMNGEIFSSSIAHSRRCLPYMYRYTYVQCRGDCIPEKLTKIENDLLA